MTTVPSSAAQLRRLGHALAALEPLFLALCAPLLLFPPARAYYVLPLLLLPWLGRLLGQGTLTRRSPLNAPVFLLLLLGILGYTVSVDRAVSHPKLWGMILQAALFFGAVNFVSTPRRLRQAAILLVALAPAVALFSFFGIDWSIVRLLPLEGLYARLPSLEPLALLPDNALPTSRPYFHPREVGGALAFLLPLPLAVLFFGRRRRLRLLAAAAALPALLVLVLTQAPMGFLALAVVLAFFALCWRWWTLVPMILAAAALGVAVLSSYGVRDLALTMLDIDHLLGIGFVLRFDMWSRALDMIAAMPLSGVGLNTYPLVLSHFYPGLLLGPEPHAHNMLLQIAVDVGLVGLLAFTWLVVAFFLILARAARHSRAPWQRALLLGLAGALLAYLTAGLLDTITLGAKPIAALWLMLGVGGAAWRVLPAPSPPAAPNLALRYVNYLSLTLLLLAVVLIPLLAPGLLPRNVGVARGHRAVYAARQTGRLPDREAAAAVNALQQALAHNPDDARLHSLLGSLYAWQGDQPAALDHLQRRVALDGPYAFRRYAPFVSWQRTLQDAPPPAPWQDTIRLYRIWSTRYPDRAENAVLLALALQANDNPTQALDAVQQALERQAQPTLLLVAQSSRLQAGQPPP